MPYLFEIMTDVWKGRSRYCFLSSFSCWWFSALSTTGLRVCVCTVTWHFQVREDVSSSYIINLALPTHPLLPELKAVSQLYWMHWHETLHSTTSVIPYIRIAFFVFYWQKWQSLCLIWVYLFGLGCVQHKKNCELSLDSINILANGKTECTVRNFSESSAAETSCGKMY